MRATRTGLDMTQLAPSVDAAIVLYGVDLATQRAAARTVAAGARDVADARHLIAVLGIPQEALMPENPAIARPLVTVSNATSTRRIARCGHCAWEYANTVKSDVEYQARMHRGQHRTGSIPGRAA
ncbi:hypothetical protein [Sanguibacter sp. HDW7]|uniref:hypothetical protein n=1 Tax=Sanguibacter sp. HDW7 TaxID=2714931 RepID=UPI00140E34F5|nr:hypothetical protein [Sanguibacter sp. HDW7]QIK83012.1 hypothetical protein G7063_04755 [Sanguibacter sp. HDW7]